MDIRNDESNNRYRLRNREHSNSDGVMSIHEQGSGNDDEEEEEEEDEVHRPHQRRRVDKTNNKDPEEILDVPRVINFEALEQALNPEGREGGYKENNGQRGALRDNQGQGGGSRRRTANNQG